MQIRIQGTKEELIAMIDSLYYNYGDQVKNISRQYPDRNGSTARVYVEIDLQT